MSGNKRRIMWLICALALAVCTAGYGQAIYLFGGDVLPGDPNEPAPAKEDPNVAWDPAEHLVPYWDSISLTSRTYNWARQPDRDPNALDRSISISAEADIVDTEGLIGLSSLPADVLVLDEDGDVFYRSEARPSFTRFYRPPDYGPTLGIGGALSSELRPYRLSVSIPIDPSLEQYPLFLTQVQWSTYVLVTDKVKTVDVPFKKTDDWFELTPGLELLVEKAVAEGTKYEYTIKARYDRDTISYVAGGTIFVHEHQPPAEKIVLEMQLLNAEGKPVGGGSGAFGSSTRATGSGGQMLATSTGSGSCGDCGQVATIRYRIAVKLYEREIHFVLEDIPVPSF